MQDAVVELLGSHRVFDQGDGQFSVAGLGLNAALVQAMEDYANQGGAYTLTLRCGFDLDANTFWAEMGYECVGVQNGGIRRMRKINVWRKCLQTELFADAVIEPAVGKTDATIWRKNKRTGLVTQFVRGKQMRDYRASVIAANERDTK